MSFCRVRTWPKWQWVGVTTRSHLPLCGKADSAAAGEHLRNVWAARLDWLTTVRDCRSTVKLGFCHACQKLFGDP